MAEEQAQEQIQELARDLAQEAAREPLDDAVRVVVVGDERYINYGESLYHLNRPKRPLSIRNWVDEDSLPAGGTADGEGFSIKWQDGPVGERGVNGAQIEDIILALTSRLQFYQDAYGGTFNSEYNANAIQHLNEALRQLELRTKERVERGVEGTHEA